MVEGRLGERSASEYGCQRLALERTGSRDLEHLSGVENVDPITHRERHPQIVGDQDEPHVASL